MFGKIFAIVLKRYFLSKTALAIKFTVVLFFGLGLVFLSNQYLIAI